MERRGGKRQACWRDGKKRRYERRVGEMERRGGMRQTCWRDGKKRRYETDVLERWKEEEV